MAWRVLTAAVVALSLAGLVLVAFGSTSENEADAAAAQRVALNWTGAELADAPRRAGDDWEVDVRRADGSLVEVTLGPALELRELDEELGRGGTPAHDEVTGALRERAIAAARPEAGPGQVRSVELERDGTIEVDVVRSNRTVIEVELDEQLRVKDIDEEDIGDE
ncbi:MAG TPA: hypothetical protein VFQ12_01755 [Thermoleophilaceae bacterium]|nr:hypothetical protein [Thermoleophilaceae bacterium]